MGYFGWKPYVSVAERRRKVEKKIAQARKKGKPMRPIVIEGKSIAKTFWGKAWCDHLESYSDYENRLPRGRTYVRNGSVIDLEVTKGTVCAQVMGSSLYQVKIKFSPMSAGKWKELVTSCAGKIDSLLELLQGKFSKAVMSHFVAKETGFFPSSKEIAMQCSCPDYAGMCKHIAAVLYGIGSAIDTQPEWLFLLRHVDHLELIAASTANQILAPSQLSGKAIAEEELSELFGIEIQQTTPLPPSKKTKTRKK